MPLFLSTRSILTQWSMHLWIMRIHSSPRCSKFCENFSTNKYLAPIIPPSDTEISKHHTNSRLLAPDFSFLTPRQKSLAWIARLHTKRVFAIIARQAGLSNKGRLIAQRSALSALSWFCSHTRCAQSMLIRVSTFLAGWTRSLVM